MQLEILILREIAHCGGQQPPCHKDTQEALCSHLDGEDLRPPINSQHPLASCVVKPRGTERLKKRGGATAQRPDVKCTTRQAIRRPHSRKTSGDYPAMNSLDKHPSFLALVFSSIK
ncbi:Fanconi anemia group B protein [Globicephala melas]|uniref:Fanconi anemia group B protein n=1 Tax=Globicephala melas TaxID=9731 RepID=UPI0038732029